MNKTMKNMFAVSASAILMFAGACTNTPEKEEVKAEPAETAAAAGTWTPAEDGTITDELMEIFEKAMDGMTGVNYTPVELLETQLVSGMNYRFLCDAVTVVPNAETRQATVTIYRDLEGNCSVLDIEDLGSEENVPVAGGWTPAEDGTITEELQEIFNKATEGLVGTEYKPVELLETQVVAGMNYKFLCEASNVVLDADTRYVFVTVYQDPQGNCSILEVEEKEEGEEGNMLGGWQKAEDGTITEELQEIFDKAVEGLTGVGYTPVELLETQLVSGMNYRFLCDAVTVVPNAETRQAIVTVYCDLNGNCSILDIQDVK